MSLSKTASALSLAIALLLPAVASAAPDDVSGAKKWFEQGISAANAGNYETARRSFAAAYALVPSVDILWNLAVAEQKVGSDVDALGHLRAYAAHPAARPDRKRLAEDLIVDLEARTARLDVSADEGAVVLVDGAARSPGLVDVGVGPHSITVRGKDGEEATRAVEAKAGDVTRLNLTSAARERERALARAAAAPAPERPSTVVLTRTAPPGADRPASHRGLVVAGLGGAALVMLAGGAYFAWTAGNDREDANQLYLKLSGDELSCKRSGTLCDDYSNARSSAQRNEGIATGLLVTGGVLGGAAMAAWLLWPNAPAQVAPTASKDAMGMTVQGRF